MRPRAIALFVGARAAVFERSAGLYARSYLSRIPGLFGGSRSQRATRTLQKASQNISMVERANRVLNPFHFTRIRHIHTHPHLHPTLLPTLPPHARARLIEVAREFMYPPYRFPAYLEVRVSRDPWQHPAEAGLLPCAALAALGVVTVLLKR